VREGLRRFTEAAQQRFIASLDEHQAGRVLAPQLAVNGRQAFQLLALARVHQQRRALDFPAAIHVELTEGGDQVHRQVIDAIEAQVLEGLQHRALAGTAQAR